MCIWRRLTKGKWLNVVAVLMLSACSGGGENSVPAGQGTINDSFSESSDNTVPESVFLPERPIVDPASSREEIASRTDMILVEHQKFMNEVFRQMDEVYRTIGSGLPSSDDPETLANDARFYAAVNEYCSPDFNNNGTMIALRNCDRLPAQFSFRHPRYSVGVITEEYSLGSNFLNEDTGVSIWDDGPMLLQTRVDDSSIYPTDLLVIFPAYSINREFCRVSLYPTKFPESNLGVNECSDLLRFTLRTLKRLNDRS